MFVNLNARYLLYDLSLTSSLRKAENRGPGLIFSAYNHLVIRHRSIEIISTKSPPSAPLVPFTTLFRFIQLACINTLPAQRHPLRFRIPTHNHTPRNLLEYGAGCANSISTKSTATDGWIILRSVVRAPSATAVTMSSRTALPVKELGSLNWAVGVMINDSTISTLPVLWLPSSYHRRQPRVCPRAGRG